MGRSRRGSGSVFQRTYRDAKGKIRKTKNWYIEFVAGNRTIREATDFTNRTDAAEFLKKRISDALGGKIVLSRNVTYDDLRDLIITDYTNNGRKSLGDLKTTRLPRLDAVFGGTKAIDITTTSVERYKTHRLKDGSAPATVNRELASLTAKEVGFRHEWIEAHEHENPDYVKNAPDRCYFCKTELFDLLERLRDERGIAAVAYGINRDDTGDFRPGHRAAEEHRVRDVDEVDGG